MLHKFVSTKQKFMHKSESRIRKQDELSTLIRSLNPNEKRYFKLFNSLQKNHNRYNELFDELCNPEDYNADTLSKKLKRTKKQLADDKDYLNSILMKALRNYHSDSDPEMIIMNSIAEIRLLSSKGLTSTALSLTKKTQKLAQEYEMWNLQWMLLMMESTFTGEFYPNISQQVKFRKIYQKQMQKTVKNIELITAFNQMDIDMMEALSKRVVSRKTSENNPMKKVLYNPLLKATYESISLQCYQAEKMAWCYFQNGQFDKALPYTKKCFELVDKYPIQCGALVNGYTVCLTDYFTSLGLCGKIKEAYTFLDKLKKMSFNHLPYEPQEIKAIMQERIITFDLWLAKSTGNYDKGKESLKQLSENYLEVVARCTEISRAELLCTAAIVSFFVHNYDDALFWVEKVLSDIGQQTRIEAHCLARIIIPLAHAELKNYSILPAVIRSSELFLKKHKYLYQAEKLTLDFLKQLPSFTNKNESKTAFENLLIDYRKLETKKYEKLGFKLFDYTRWAEQNLK